MIYNHDTVPITIDTAALLASGVQGPFHLVSQLLRRTLMSGDSLRVTVEYCPIRSSQYGCDSDTLRLLSGTSSRDVILRGCGDIRRIVVSTETLDFGDADVGSLKDKSYTIANPGPLPVIVLTQNVETGTDFNFAPQQQLSFKLDSGQALPIKVRFQPVATSNGKLRDSITITSNAANGSVGIVLTGNVPPVWLITPAVDFGDVRVGRDSSIDVYLTNISSSIVQVQKAILANPFGKVGFDVSPKSATPVSPGASLTLKITFTPTDTGYVQDKLEINDPGTSSYAAITLTGRGIRDTLVVDGTLSAIPVLFNPVALGDSTEASFTVRNNGNVAATLDSGAIDNSAFTVVGITPSRLIAPSNTAMITLRFKPTAPGPASATWESKPYKLSVPLYATAAYRVWVDTAFGKAGDRISLALRVGPPLRSQAITGFTAELNVEPTALLADSISNNHSLLRSPSGRITIQSTSSATVSDSVLAIITFRGLSTGQPENVVSLDAFTFTPALPVELRNGRLYLSGCDIGRTALAARRSKISALKSSPGSDQAELTYSAAEGASVAVRVVGIDGQLLKEETLPDGTGADQTVMLPLAELPPGLVFVELRVVNDRSTIPLMIIR